MPAVAEQQLAAIAQGLSEIEPFDTASGATPFFAVTAEDNDGPIKFLQKARGDDSNDADVPGRLTIDDHEISGSIGPCSGSPKGLLKDAALDALAFAILGIELAGECPGLFKLGGKEKI